MAPSEHGALHCSSLLLSNHAINSISTMVVLGTILNFNIAVYEVHTIQSIVSMILLVMFTTQPG